MTYQTQISLILPLSDETLFTYLTNRNKIEGRKYDKLLFDQKNTLYDPLRVKEKSEMKELCGLMMYVGV